MHIQFRGTGNHAHCAITIITTIITIIIATITVTIIIIIIRTMP
jgi:hypothetical protein